MEVSGVCQGKGGFGVSGFEVWGFGGLGVGGSRFRGLAGHSSKSDSYPLRLDP